MKFTPRCDQFIMMKDLEMNPHRIDFERMAREWPPEFGEDRPSPSDIKRRLENLRDTALEKRHVQSFSIKRVRSESAHSQRHQQQASNITPRSSSLSPDTMVLKQEELSDDMAEEKLTRTPSIARTLRSEPKPTSCKSCIAPNTSSRRRQFQGPQLPQRGQTPAHDSDDLPDLDAMIGTKGKDKDMMKLRSIPKPQYQNDGVTYHDDDTEYDPTVERAEEDRRRARNERQRQRATRFAAAQSTSPHTDRGDPLLTDSAPPSASQRSDIMSSQPVGKVIARSQTNKTAAFERQARPPLQSQHETYMQGNTSQSPKRNTDGFSLDRQLIRDSDKTQQQGFRNSGQDWQRQTSSQETREDYNADTLLDVADMPLRKKKKNKSRKHERDTNVQDTENEPAGSAHRQDSSFTENVTESKRCDGSVSPKLAALKIPKKKKKSHKRHRSEED